MVGRTPLVRAGPPGPASRKPSRDGFASKSLTGLILFYLWTKMASFRHFVPGPQTQAKKTGIIRRSPASKALEGAPRSNHGLLKISTNLSRTSDYPAFALGLY